VRRRSIFTPLTLAALAVSLLSTLLLFIAVEMTIAREARRTLSATIDTDMTGLADLYLSGGEDELRRRIRDRIVLGQENGEHAYYLAVGPEGRRTGNFRTWPSLAAEASELGVISDGSVRVLVRVTQLPGNVRLLVGRSLAQSDALLGRIRIAFVLAGLIVASLSLLVGRLASRRLRGRVDNLNLTLAAIENGAITCRAEAADRQDELGDLARRVNRMLDQVERLITAQRDVSDHMAHEIRTPLMHLDTKLQQLLALHPDAATSEQLGEARVEIRQMTALLDSLLDIAGAEAMKGDVRGLAEVNLSSIGEAVAELYEASADDLGLSFSASIEPDVRLRADPMQISRLLVNVLDNAFKYVPAGGSVRMSIGPGPRILMEDDGPGIAPADRERIFQRYARVQTGKAGHGLGLALARAIAERHRLVIRVEDAGPGARFVIEPEDSA
jgi:signal transduction histidine kinase